MAFSLSGWRPKHLVVSWVAYWIGAAAIKLGPAIETAWHVTRDGSHGTISGGFGDQGFRLTMLEGTKTVFDQTVGTGILALWIAGPPLLLWLVWLLTRKRPIDESAAPTAIEGVRGVSRALGEGPASDVGVPQGRSRAAERDRP